MKLKYNQSINPNDESIKRTTEPILPRYLRRYEALLNGSRKTFPGLQVLIEEGQDTDDWIVAKVAFPRTPNTVTLAGKSTLQNLGRDLEDLSLVMSKPDLVFFFQSIASGLHSILTENRIYRFLCFSLGIAYC